MAEVENVVVDNHQVDSSNNNNQRKIIVLVVIVVVLRGTSLMTVKRKSRDNCGVVIVKLRPMQIVPVENKITQLNQQVVVAIVVKKLNTIGTSSQLMNTRLGRHPLLKATTLLYQRLLLIIPLKLK